MTSGPTVFSTCYWLCSLNYSCYANCISHLAPSCLHISDTGPACTQPCSFTWETRIVSGRVLNVPLLSESWLNWARLRSSVRMKSSCCNFRWIKRRVCGVLWNKNKSLKIVLNFLLVSILKSLWYISVQLFGADVQKCSSVNPEYFTFQVH